MKRNNKYYLRNIADTFFLYPSDDINEIDKKLVFLNETSAFLWKQMEEDCTIGDLVKALIEKYSVQENVATQHITDFVAFLESNGILDSVV